MNKKENNWKYKIGDRIVDDKRDLTIINTNAINVDLIVENIMIRKMENIKMKNGLLNMDYIVKREDAHAVVVILI